MTETPRDEQNPSSDPSWRDIMSEWQRGIYDPAPDTGLDRAWTNRIAQMRQNRHEFDRTDSWNDPGGEIASAVAEGWMDQAEAYIRANPVPSTNLDEELRFIMDQGGPLSPTGDGCDIGMALDLQRAGYSPDRAVIYMRGMKAAFQSASAELFDYADQTAATRATIYHSSWADTPDGTAIVKMRGVPIDDPTVFMFAADVTWPDGTRDLVGVAGYVHPLDPAWQDGAQQHWDFAVTRPGRTELKYGDGTSGLIADATPPVWTETAFVPEVIGRPFSKEHRYTMAIETAVNELAGAPYVLPEAKVSLVAASLGAQQIGAPSMQAAAVPAQTPAVTPVAQPTPAQGIHL